MRIGVLTSGGDAPGMNAALRSLVKVARFRGHDVVGVRRGYVGLLEGDAIDLPLSLVDGISRHGGTILGSARCKELPTPEGQRRAVGHVAALGLDALVVIGGNGSLTGAHVLASQTPCRIVGVPASIDNDVGHTGLAIGVDTAVNTIVEACDRISDTASAHRRVFVVEVMGRQCGYLAMRAGIAAEADAILFAEKAQNEDALVEKLVAVVTKSFDAQRDKRRVLIIKAEGVAQKTARLVERLASATDAEVRETILGHVVRGGSPSQTDRVIAQRLALGALLAIEEARTDVMIAWETPGGAGERTADPSVRRVPLSDVIEESQRLVDGTSPVARARIDLLQKFEGVLAL